MKHDDAAMMSPNMILLAVVAVAVLGLAIVAGVTITSLPGYVLLAGLAVLALFILTKFGGVKFTGAGKTGRALLIGLALVVGLLLAAPTIPAVENLVRDEPNRLQDVTISGTVTLDQNFVTDDKASFPAVDVTWQDSKLAAWNFHAFCAWYKIESDPVTVNARLVDESGQQADYTASVDVGKACGYDPQNKKFTLTIPRVVPGQYTVYVSATQPDGSNAKILGTETAGGYLIKHRPGQ